MSDPSWLASSRPPLRAGEQSDYQAILDTAQAIGLIDS